MGRCNFCGIFCDDGEEYCKTCKAKQNVLNKRHQFIHAIYFPKVREKPDDPSVLLEYGEKLVGINALIDAVEQFDSVLSLDSVNESAIAHLVRIYGKWGEEDVIEEKFDFHRRGSDKLPESYVSLAIVRREQGKINEAINLLEEGRVVFPDDEQISKALNSFRQTAPKPRKTNNIKVEVEKITEPATPEQIAIMAGTYMGSGELESAFSWYERLLEKKNDHPQALLYTSLNKILTESPDIGNPQSIEAELSKIEKTALKSDDMNVLKACRIMLDVAIEPSATVNLDEILGLLGSDALLEPVRENLVLLFTKKIFQFAAADKTLSNLVKLQSAIIDLKELVDTPHVRKKAAQLVEKVGDTYAATGDTGSASDEYDLALQLDPSNKGLQLKKKSLDKKIKMPLISRPSINLPIKDSLQSVMKRPVLFGLPVVIFLALIGLYYIFGYGYVEIQTNIPAQVRIFKGDNLVFKQMGKKSAKSKRLGPWTYTVVVLKPGFRKIREDVRIGFGGKTHKFMYELKPLTGKFKIDTKPSGAEVRIDGKLLGKTPFFSKEILAKKQKLTIALEGYNSYEPTVEIKPEKQIDLGVVSFAGQLKIDSNPSEARVFIDDRDVGFTPLVAKGVAAKEVSIWIIKDGLAQYKGVIDVFPMKLTDAGVIKLEEVGSLALDSDPSGANVYINDELAGRTPFSLPNAIPGKIRIRLEYEGLLDYNSEFTVKGSSKLNIGTIKLKGVLVVQTIPKGADVYLDGEPVGVTSLKSGILKIEDVPARAYELTVSKGRCSYTKGITIEIGKDTKSGWIHLCYEIIDHETLTIYPDKQWHSAAIFPEKNDYIEISPLGTCSIQSVFMRVGKTGNQVRLEETAGAYGNYVGFITHHIMRNPENQKVMLKNVGTSACKIRIRILRK